MKQELIQCALTHGRRFVRYGKPASYIPELASKDPSKLGIAVCDMEGNIITAGDCKEKFSMQSISKVMALIQQGGHGAHRRRLQLDGPAGPSD